MENKSIIAIFAVALMAATVVICVLPVADDSSADPAYGEIDATIQVAPGYRYSWAPSWPSDLHPTLTIEKQTIGSLTGTATNVASISGSSIIVKIPSSASAGTDYHIVVKAATVNPTQTDYIYIVFHVNPALSITSTNAHNVKAGDAVSITPVVTGLGTKTFTIINAPAWLTVNSNTGVVSGTSSAPGDVSFTLKVTNNFGETAQKTISFHVATKLAPTDTPTAGALIYEV